MFTGVVNAVYIVTVVSFIAPICSHRSCLPCHERSRQHIR